MNSTTLTPGYLVVCFALGIPACLEAQSLARHVVSSGGGVAQSGNVCLTWTVGEAVTDAGFSVFADGGFQQSTGYDLWSGALGVTGGPVGDPDGDGWSNLLEYALGTNPLSKNGGPAIPVTVDASGKITITVTKAPGVSNLAWSAESSTDLVTWTSSGINVIADNATTFIAETAGGGRRRYMRVQVTLLDGK